MTKRQKAAIDELIAQKKYNRNFTSPGQPGTEACKAAHSAETTDGTHKTKFCRNTGCRFRHECERYFLYGSSLTSYVVKHRPHIH
jgi:hypothetical protein